MNQRNLSEQEIQRRVRIAKNLYQRKWRKKNKDKHLANMEKFWLRQYALLMEDGEKSLFEEG